jgi:hypothetical protein
VRPLCDEIAALKNEIVEIRKRGVEFKGSYQRANPYRTGSVVNFDGGMWVAIEDTDINDVPGQSNKWQLSVKAPRRPTMA